MSIKVYDSNGQYHQYRLPCFNASYNQMINGATGTKIVGGNTWTISRSGTDVIHWQFTTGELGDMNASYVSSIMSSLGYPTLEGFAAYDLPTTGILNTPNHEYQLAGSNNSQTSQYYTYKLFPEPDDYVIMGFAGGSFQTGIGGNGAACLAFFGSDVSGYFGHIFFSASPYNPTLHVWIYKDMTPTSSQIISTPDPGEPGFIPAGNKAHRPTGGGIDSGWHPVYPTDELEQPGAPDESVASVTRTGFLHIYQLSEANLVKLGKCLFDGLLAKLNNIFMSPLDSIVSLQIFPCTPNVGSREAVKVLKYNCISADLGEDCVANKLAAQFETYDFGTLAVDEMWNSFLDYDATSFSLYLPFIGTVDIPVGEVMGGSINVQYTVDFLTGMCVANVFCRKSVTLSDGSVQPQKAQHSYMGNCSIQIPLAQESYGNIVGSLMQAASAGLTGGIGAGVASVVGSAASGGFKPTIETKGTINANAGFCSILYPYITITRPITAEPESYQEVMGYPSYVVNKLGECKDLCICDNIDLSGLSGATDSEMDRIRQMCKDGVYV